MQRTHSITTALLLLACGALQGCELVADFDRGKIPTGALDASILPPQHPVLDDDAGAASQDEDAATASK
jgi:hypothetical protein